MKRTTILFPTLAIAIIMAVVPAARVGADPKAPVHTGKHVSGAAQLHAPANGGRAGGGTACSTPGGGNYLVNCHGSGAPVNEPSIASSGGLIIVGANDFNSYNGFSQNGFYWSFDGKTWNDAGPIDLNPHAPTNAASDSGVAFDSKGVAYYSSAFYDPYDCTVGSAVLLRGQLVKGTWSWNRTQIETNSLSLFHDKPSVAVGGKQVYVSWTAFDSCAGGGQSPIKVAVLATGAVASSPTAILSVPGSQFSQGSAMAPDGAGGFWITWEEFPTGSATIGSIKIAHYTRSGWDLSSVNVISPAGFADLANPLPGFRFRTDSFPAIAMTSNGPIVAWTSNDSGVGRAYLWSQPAGATAISPTGGDQFFAAVAPDTSGGVYVSFSQTDPATSSFDEYVWHQGSVVKVSTAPSFPNNDTFFNGGFIGDYNSMTSLGANARTAWADIRTAEAVHSGFETDVMTASP